MNQTIKELFNRKSVRQYEDKPIEEDIKRLIVDAAIQAPSAGNMCLYSIIDVTEQELKNKLAISCDNQPFIAAAPMVLVFCVDYSRWFNAFSNVNKNTRKPGAGDLFLAMEDTLIAAQNSVVAAESLGIGSCYIGDILENYELHKEMFKLPKYVVPIALIVYGYPTKHQSERNKLKRFSAEDIVYKNTYKSTSIDGFIKMLALRNDKNISDTEQSIAPFCKRKWDSDFSIEMTRSVEELIKDWNE